jgi:hypothetical protein
MGPSGTSTECTSGGGACHGHRRRRPNFLRGLIAGLMGTTLKALDYPILVTR